MFPTKRRVPLPLAIFFGVISVAGFIMLAGFVWFAVVFANADWNF